MFFGLGGKIMVQLPWLVTLDLMIQQIMETKGEVFQGKRMGQPGGDMAMGARKELALSCR